MPALTPHPVAAVDRAKSALHDARRQRSRILKASALDLAGQLEAVIVSASCCELDRDNLTALRHARELVQQAELLVRGMK